MSELTCNNISQLDATERQKWTPITPLRVLSPMSKCLPYMEQMVLLKESNDSLRSQLMLVDLNDA